MNAHVTQENSTPQVSVIVPAYQMAKYISTALDSVLAQSFRSFEIIVVNDGSPDTPDLERALQRFMAQIVYLKQPNGGLAQARNTGIRNSRAPFIALLDPDDYWDSDYLATQIQILTDDPTADVVYPNAVFFGSPDFEGKIYMDLFPSEGDVNFLSVVTRQCNIMGGVTARKVSLERAGLYDPNIRYAEDFDLWLRLLKLGARIVYHHRVLCHLRVRSDSLSRQAIEMRGCLLEILTKSEKQFELSADERAAVELAGRTITAELQLERGKLAFYEGDFETAIRDITAGNRYRGSWKLRFILALMKTAPRTLRWMARIRK